MNNLGSQQASPSPASLTQQFCLRWHNHQTSLLTSLPLLLDQSHLTDVTLSAEGRTVRAHRVVLSACSTFFSELFRTMEPPFHPVIVIPGASFGAVVALLTFMYSGEVNVFEEQITTLLSLAETLGIKGLADFSGNISKSSPSNCETPVPKDTEIQTPATPTPPSPPSASSVSPTKLGSPLDNIYAKTLQFCPSMMANPLNFSPSAISRGAEIFARYQTQCRLNQLEQKANEATTNVDENGNSKFFLNMEAKGRKAKMSDMRKIDKIAENLRTASSTSGKVRPYLNHQEHINKQLMSQNSPAVSPLIMKTAPVFGNAGHRYSGGSTSDDIKPSIDCMSSQSNVSADTVSHAATTSYSHVEPVAIDPSMLVDKSSLVAAAAACGITQKPSNSKLYATCFICHKQLSNQYNLRVHLETHQNVRYACSVCTHVSRSKDALRKHVSYRHPGAPSPCESESKRKRSRASTSMSIAHSQQQQQLQQQLSIPTSSPLTLHSSSPIIKSEIINDLSMSPSASTPHNIPMSSQFVTQTQLYGHVQSLPPATSHASTAIASPISTSSSSSPSCRMPIKNIDPNVTNQKPSNSPSHQLTTTDYSTKSIHSKCND